MHKLYTKVAAMKIGDGTEQGVVQGPLINMEAVDKIERHIADAVKRGARVVTGPDSLVSQEETLGPPQRSREFGR